LFENDCTHRFKNRVLKKNIWKQVEGRNRYNNNNNNSFYNENK